MTMPSDSAAPAGFASTAPPAVNTWPRQPRRLEAGRGAAWWGEGWRVFMASPGLWIGIIVVWFVAMFVLAFIPVLGSIAQTLLWPVITAGALLGCHALARGQPLEFAHLFAGFKSPQFANLVVLGLIALVLTVTLSLVVLGAMAAMIGTAGLGAMLDGDSAASLTAAMGMGVAVLVIVPLGLLCTALFMMAWWFAVPLVTLNGAKPVEALKSSFSASWANIGAFLIYGLIFIALAILATIPMGLGWLVLAPVAIGASYASWREVYGD